MLQRLFAVALAAAVFIGCAGNMPIGEPVNSVSPKASEEPIEPTRVILFIGDGVGTAYWSAAKFAADELAIEEFPVIGLVDTRSASHKVTDSAAGATVYATGVRTFNYAIGVGPDSLPLQTVLELAVSQEMATGLVATSTITHATPASFAAHVVHRRMESEIARQMARQGIDVLLGGGRQYFDGSAEDASDLLPELRGEYTYVEDDSSFFALDLDTVPALLGLFADRHMPRATKGRSPGLPSMTRAALEIVDKNPKGFFLMVEASQPDWRGHSNEPIEEVIAEMLDYDDAVRVALEYQAENPETLIILTADHETGGLAIQQTREGELLAKYTTTGHTGSMIPLFAKGPGAERFGGVQENYRIGQLLLEIIRGAAAGATESEAISSQ